MHHHALILSVVACLPAALAQDEPKQTWPDTKAGHYVVEDFTFDNGDKMDKLELHYKTLGNLTIREDGSTNAVLVMHGSTGSSEQFLNDDFASVLFNPGQVLDANEYFIILRDGIGHGNSTKPSDGLRASFPSYQYTDMIRADHQLLTEHFGINHTRLTMGVSMGGMQTWMWGEMYPDFMDGLFAISSSPVEIAGHNRLWRKLLTELIITDPAWKEGDYEEQPIVGLSAALSLSLIMLSSPAYYQQEFPTRQLMDSYVDGLLPEISHFDANDQLYAWNASVTYNPADDLDLIKVPLTAVNTADDLMNPPELEFLERGVEKMKPGLGRAVIVPASNQTTGHDSYIKAELWKDELQLLLAKSSSNSSCLV